MQDWLFKDTDYNWRLLPRKAANSAPSADIGTHWMDTVSSFSGARITVRVCRPAYLAQSPQASAGRGRDLCEANGEVRYASYKVQTEDFASVLLQFSNGARGNLGVSRSQPGAKIAFGSRSTARKSRPGGVRRIPSCLQFRQP